VACATAQRLRRVCVRERERERSKFTSREYEFSTFLAPVTLTLTCSPWRYTACANTNLLHQGFRQLSSDRHTDTTKIIYHSTGGQQKCNTIHSNNSLSVKCIIHQLIAKILLLLLLLLFLLAAAAAAPSVVVEVVVVSLLLLFCCCFLKI